MRKWIKNTDTGLWHSRVATREEKQAHDEARRKCELRCKTRKILGIAALNPLQNYAILKAADKLDGFHIVDDAGQIINVETNE